MKLCLLVIILFTGNGFAATMGKDQTMAHLNSIKTQYQKRMQELDEQIVIEIRKTTTGSAPIQEDQLLKMRSLRQGNSVRLELVDRVIFYMNQNFSTTPLKILLEQKVQQMISQEMGVGRAKQNSETTLLRYLIRLKNALSGVSEDDRVALNFFEGFLKNEDPKGQGTSVATKSYSNDFESEADHSIGVEEAGDFVDKILHPQVNPSQDSPEEIPLQEPPAREGAQQPFDPLREARNGIQLLGI